MADAVVAGRRKRPSSARECVLVALDYASLAQADPIVRALAPEVAGFKFGLQIINSAGLPAVAEFVRSLHTTAFLDPKLHDIPNTVGQTALVYTQPGVSFFNVHALGGRTMMKAAADAATTMTAKQAEYGTVMQRPKVLGVTILTSHSREDLEEIGFQPFGVTPPRRLGDPREVKEYPYAPDPEQTLVRDLVVRLAKLSQSAGLDGVVCSPEEIGVIREACGEDFLIVTPGVRPEWAATNDQKRVMTPRQAIQAGADYLVIGRPITNPPEGIPTTIDAVARINDELLDLGGD